MGEIYVPRGPQLEGIQWIVKHSFAGLFWDPGRGKTITILQAYKILRDAGYVRNMMVTSSVNVIEDVWPEEMEKFDDLDLTYAFVGGGSEKKRLTAWDLEADVYLINYENLYWLNTEFGPDIGIDMLVVDESSKFRNGRMRKPRRKKKRKQPDRNAFRNIMKMVPNFKRRYILTGTPIPKGYLNLWPQMHIVDRGQTLGLTVTEYRNRYFRPTGFMGKNWVLMDGQEKAIEKVVAPRIHRAERDNKVPIEFFDLEVKITGKAWEAYRELEIEFITEYKSKVLIAANAATATVKLRQAANGAVYYDRQKNWLAIHEKKLLALKELIEELQGQPLLVVYEFEHDYETMLKFGLNVPRYAGSKIERKKLKTSWDRREIPVMAAQIQAVSHGLNLQYGGNNIAFYGLTFNLDDYEQAYQRLWRDGQENAVIAYNIVARHTVDEVMMEVLAARSKTQRGLLKSLADGQKKLYRALKEHYDLR